MQVDLFKGAHDDVVLYVGLKPGRSNGGDCNRRGISTSSQEYRSPASSQQTGMTGKMKVPLFCVLYSRTCLVFWLMS